MEINNDFFILLGLYYFDRQNIQTSPVFGIFLQLFRV